jgi:hypothetical protein
MSACLPNSGAKADMAGGPRRAKLGLMHRSKVTTFLGIDPYCFAKVTS